MLLLQLFESLTTFKKIEGIEQPCFVDETAVEKTFISVHLPISIKMSNWRKYVFTLTAYRRSSQLKKHHTIFRSKSIPQLSHQSKQHDPFWLNNRIRRIWFQFDQAYDKIPQIDIYN